MSAVPPPGYPMTEFGKTIYAKVRQQAPPSIRYSMAWWLNWFNDVSTDPAMRAWVSETKRRTPSDISVAAAEVLMQFGPQLVSSNQANPAESEDAQNYRVMPLVTTMQGWSLWSGQHDVPIPEGEWRKVVVSYLQWVCREIAKGNLGTRALDIALHYMVLPEAEDRKYPNLSAPVALKGLAQEGWHLWKVSTGGNEPLAIYSRSSMEQWQRLNDSFQHLDRALGGAERVLRYASLQEPVLRLQEKLDEFGSKQHTLAAAFETYAENEGAAARALTAREQQDMVDMRQEFYRIQKSLYDTLPKGMWRGEEPSNLSGWVLIAGVGATLAVGLVAAVAAAIAAVDSLVTRQRGMNLQVRIEEELKAMAAQAEATRQECRFAAGNIQDTTRRNQMMIQCDRDAQRTLAELAKQQARVAESATALRTLTPQKPPTESSALYIGLGIAAWFGLRWVRKRV